MFDLEALSFRYNDAPAVDRLDLSIDSGKTSVLLGTSGSGKSTVLRLMLGLLSPQSGNVLFQSTNIRQIDPLVLRRAIGFMTQSGGLFPHLSVAGNVTLVAKAARWSPARILERLHSLCDLLQIDRELLDRFPHELSGGQRQRVALMRALMLDPPCILLDEPLGALDPLTRFDLQSELKTIFTKFQKTVVLVTHDLHESRFFGDTIHLLHEGRLQQSGAYDDLRDRPANEFVARFFAAQRARVEG